MSLDSMVLSSQLEEGWRICTLNAQWAGADTATLLSLLDIFVGRRDLPEERLV